MPTHQPRPRIAISAGHHNLTGGNALEIEIVGPVTAATIAHLLSTGADVRSITPRNGLGTLPGRLDKVAATVAAWAAAGWRADLFFEIHAEANGRGDQARGSFLIYPDARDGTDTDLEARDVLAPLLTRHMLEQTGIPARGPGHMSEQKTGVGLEGHRLGIFAGTAQYRASMTRAIFEIGSYTSRADLEIMQAEQFSADAGRAIGTAIAAFFAEQPPITPIQFYRVKVAAGANVRKKPNAYKTTGILKALPRGASWPGLPVIGDDGKAWIKGTVAGYIRADLLERTA